MISSLRQENFDVNVQDLTLKAEELKDSASLYFNDYSDSFSQVIITGRGSKEMDQIVGKAFDPEDYRGFDAVGFSIHHFGHFLFAVMLARKLRDSSDIPVIFGGAFITIWGYLYPEIFDFIDYMVVGDGRKPFPELLKCIERKGEGAGEVPNLIYRKDNKLIRAGFVRYPFEDVPVPDFTDFDLESYKEPSSGELVLPYEPTRGCIYRCSFCIRNPMEKGYQTKPYNKIVKDLTEMKNKYGCIKFQFCDHNIACSYEYLDGLSDAFIAEGLGIEWRPFMDIRKADLKLLKKMKKAGCEVIFYGIESGNNRTLKMIHKDQSSEQAARVLRWTKKAGIKTLAAFMIGCPHEEDRSIKATVRFIKKNKKYIDFAVVRNFSIVESNFMSKDPSEYGIRSLRRSPVRYAFGYDETGGLLWEDKIKQRKRAMKSIEDALWG